MYKKHKIGIVIPAHNEENFIVETIKSLPAFIDEYVVIDDASNDKTAKKVKTLKNKKIVVIENKTNGGVGYSIKKGFYHFLQIKSVDIICITAGDNQFEGKYLTAMIESIIQNKCDYAKSNRFLDTTSLNKMPGHRLIGNVVFTLLTKFASGYYTIFDALNAFSATRLSTIKKMDMDEIGDRFDFEISYLLQFAYLHSRVQDFFTPVKYGGEVSDVNYFSTVMRILKTLVIGFFRRINRKYVFFNFHPVALFFYIGSLFFLFGLGMGTYIAVHSFGPKSATTATVMLSVVPFIVGIQFILQAIVLDIQNEPK